MLKLLIARHGNTFDKGDTILRVGSGSDLPLSKSGVAQAIQLGHYLKKHYNKIDQVYVSELQRTQQTAQHALATMQTSAEMIIDKRFNEIDYGQDEGKPESEVVARLGKDALARWDNDAIPPQGWLVDPQQIRQTWCEFTHSLAKTDKTVLVVTSNGIARFIDAILPKETQLNAEHKKLATGAIALFEYHNNQWHCEYWNKKPQEIHD